MHPIYPSPPLTHNCPPPSAPAPVQRLEPQPAAQRVALVAAEEQRHAAQAQVALAVALAVQRVQLGV